MLKYRHQPTVSQKISYLTHKLRKMYFSRFLIKSGKQALEGIPQPGSVSYLSNSFNHKPTVDIISDFGLVELFEKVSEYSKIFSRICF